MAKKRPRGTTTRSPSGLVKKTFWFNQDEADRLRLEAFRQEVSQADLVRQAVRLMFKMPDPAGIVATGENIAQDLAEELENSPALRRELEQLLEQYATDPERVAELRRALEQADDSD